MVRKPSFLQFEELRLPRLRQEDSLRCEASRVIYCVPGMGRRAESLQLQQNVLFRV